MERYNPKKYLIESMEDLYYKFWLKFEHTLKSLTKDDLLDYDPEDIGVEVKIKLQFPDIIGMMKYASFYQDSLLTFEEIDNISKNDIVSVFEKYLKLNSDVIHDAINDSRLFYAFDREPEWRVDDVIYSLSKQILEIQIEIL